MSEWHVSCASLWQRSQTSCRSHGCLSIDYDGTCSRANETQRVVVVVVGVVVVVVVVVVIACTNADDQTTWESPDIRNPNPPRTDKPKDRWMDDWMHVWLNEEMNTYATCHRNEHGYVNQWIREPVNAQMMVMTWHGNPLAYGTQTHPGLKYQKRKEWMAECVEYVMKACLLTWLSSK